MVLLYGTGEATSRELQLFDQAYNSYLSYRPEEAVEGFKKFLQEFPNSFAKDAALFWLAQSLLHTKSISEAKETFACLREQFPDSPFLRYVPEDLKTMNDDQQQETMKRGAIETEEGDTSRLPEAVAIPERATGGSVSDNADGEHLQAAASKATAPSSKEGRNEGKSSLYALQVGSFKTKDSALSLKERLQKQFPMKRITICQQGGFFKVRIAGFNNIDEVHSIVGKGFDALVIKTNSTACGPVSQPVVSLPR